MLEKKIEELGTYFDGMFRMNDGFNAVRVIIPESWAIYETKNDDYSITPHKVFDNGIQKILFLGSEKARIVDIMDFAKQVIMNNLENETKKKLFQTKVAELAKIFDTNQLSQLENLVFKFEKPKKIKKVQSEDVNLEPINVDEVKIDDNKKEQVNESEEDIEAKVQEAILKAQQKIGK